MPQAVVACRYSRRRACCTTCRSLSLLGEEEHTGGDKSRGLVSAAFDVVALCCPTFHWRKGWKLAVVQIYTACSHSNVSLASEGLEAYTVGRLDRSRIKGFVGVEPAFPDVRNRKVNTCVLVDPRVTRVLRRGADPQYVTGVESSVSRFCPIGNVDDELVVHEIDTRDGCYE